MKTDERLLDLKKVTKADFLRAAADLLEGKGLPGFRKNRDDGWVVAVCGEEFAHRHLIAQAIHCSSLREGPPISLSPDDFGNNGNRYKAVLEEKFGLSVMDL